MATIDELALILGRLDANVAGLLSDAAEEKDYSRRNRQHMHKRMDEQAERIAQIETSLKISALDIGDVKTALETHQKDVLPSVADWKRMKALGLGIAGVIALGGLSIGSLIVWAGDTTAQVLRHWLKLGA